MSLACICIVDVLIAATSCIVLSRYRTGMSSCVYSSHPAPCIFYILVFFRTDSVITTLMLYVMNTGVLTRLVSGALDHVNIF